MQITEPCGYHRGPRSCVSAYLDCVCVCVCVCVCECVCMSVCLCANGHR